MSRFTPRLPTHRSARASPHPSTGTHQPHRETTRRIFLSQALHDLRQLQEVARRLRYGSLDQELTHWLDVAHAELQREGI